ncbi:hypothetical protein UNSWCD_197 [Campylobacter concisus UNSWCD]|nr:hypothetical protein [Campylobacter concisus]EIF07313.1 hypothetical protein UNSWCD_197 [Campylobacter concisus UNSWCD]
MNQKECVIEALASLGGMATLLIFTIKLMLALGVAKLHLLV